MLHVRVASPADRTGELVEKLSAQHGVRNLVVLAKARRPEGDIVQFDVRDGAANPVFETLRGQGLDRDGLISVERVDAVLDAGTVPRTRTRYLTPEIAPVWEMVEATIRAGADYPPSFFILLTIAGLIGAAGILTNSQILIVGAMVVGPEYNAIIAVALGLSKKERGPVRSGLLALFWGFLAAVVMTLAFGLMIKALGATPAEYLV